MTFGEAMDDLDYRVEEINKKFKKLHKRDQQREYVKDWYQGLIDINKGLAMAIAELVGDERYES